MVICWVVVISRRSHACPSIVKLSIANYIEMSVVKWDDMEWRNHEVIVGVPWLRLHLAEGDWSDCLRCCEWEYCANQCHSMSAFFADDWWGMVSGCVCERASDSIHDDWWVSVSGYVCKPVSALSLGFSPALVSGSVNKYHLPLSLDIPPITMSESDFTFKVKWSMRCLECWDVFEEAKAEARSLHCSCDCAMDVLSDEWLADGQRYWLSLDEDDVLREWIEDDVWKGLSWGSMLMIVVGSEERDEGSGVERERGL